MGRSVEERFWQKVDVAGPDDCWTWQAGKTRYGYGKFRIGPASKGHIHAHRMAYQLMVGEIPAGLELDHLCHTRDKACPGRSDCPHRPCVNPAHLEPVTRTVNLLRGRGPAAVNAAKSECIHGHPFNAANTYVWRGMRGCRTCRHDRQVKWLQKQKEVA